MPSNEGTEEELDCAECVHLARYWKTFVAHGDGSCSSLDASSFFIRHRLGVVFSATFGTFCLFDGAITLMKFFAVSCCMPELQDNKLASSSAFLLGCICSTSLGVISIVQPAATAEAMLMILASWFIFIGGCQMWFSFLLADWCSGLIGFLYLVTGLTFVFDLDGNVDFFILWIGVCLVMLGVHMIVLCFMLKHSCSGSGQEVANRPVAETMDV